MRWDGKRKATLCSQRFDVNEPSEAEGMSFSHCSTTDIKGNPISGTPLRVVNDPKWESIQTA